MLRPLRVGVFRIYVDRHETGDAEPDTAMNEDIRYALRSLRRAPLFVVAVTLTLALGIGANTAVFSVVRGVLLRPLPHADGDRLVYLRQSAELAGVENALFSVPEILDYRDARGLAGVAEISVMAFNLTVRGEPAQVTAGIVTGNFFEVMGLGRSVGRVFDSGDDGEAAAPVIVLTHDYWNRAFGGDPEVVGQAVQLQGRAATIVGVVQDAPHYPERTDILVNMVTSPHHLSATMVHGRTHRMTEVFARLSPGSTLVQAQVELDGIAGRLSTEYPEAYEAAAGYRIQVSPLFEVLTRRARGTIFLLWTTTTFVLLIACTSAANLVLTRSVRREQELTVRAALGGTSREVRRLLVAESLPLAIGGATLGALVAFLGVDLLASFAGRLTPRASEIALDRWVLGFTLGVGLLVSIALGWTPAVPGRRGGALPLSSAGRPAAGSRRLRRIQHGLVIAQVALSVTLLTGAGLLTRTLLNLYNVDIGADIDEVLTLEVPVVGTGRTSGEVRDIYERMRGEIAALPGVAEVGVGSTVPLRDNEFELEVSVEGVALDPNLPAPRAEYRTATPEYFRATGIPVVAGRDFLATDDANGPLVVILNESLAGRIFADQDPLGRRVAWTGEVLNFIPVSGDWRTVVGIAGDTRSANLDEVAASAMYLPFAQEQEAFGGSLVVRAHGDPQSLLLPATQVVRDVDPSAPLGTVGTLSDLREETVSSERVNALLVSGFGIVALLIAAVGIAGVLGFSVSQRTSEIGVRMSLGAHPWRVRAMILGDGLKLVLIGLGIGAVGSVFASRVVEGLLFGVAVNDPTTLIGVALVIAAVGVAGSWVPAARASSVQPIEALRSE